MKHLLVIIAIAFFPALMPTNNTIAQKNSSGFIFANRKMIRDFDSKFGTFKKDTIDKTTITYNGLLAVNTKTINRFKKDYKEAAEVSWEVQPNLNVARFTKGEIKHTVMYDGKGHSLFTMLTYNEKYLSAEVSNVIEGAYPKFSITLINEIHQNNSVVYLIHLESSREIKLVTVCNGELNIYQQYVKYN